MCRSHKKISVLSLTLFWVVATSLLAPLGVLAHANYGMGSGKITDAVHVLKASPTAHCEINDHSDSVGNMAGCQFACDHYVDSPDYRLVALQAPNTFGKSELFDFRYPPVAMLERPPKHSA